VSEPNNREDILRWVSSRRDALNRRDVAALTRLFAPDCVVDSPTAGGTIRGLAAANDIDRAWTTGFPDVTFGTDDVIVDGDRVVWVATARGTDTGGFMGLPPTGRPFELPMVVFITLRHGLITAERRIYDFTGMLVQIGILKARPAGAKIPSPSPPSNPGATTETAILRTPTRDEVSELLARRARAWADRNVEALAGQHAADGVMASNLAGLVRGPSAIRNVYATWFTAFPDSQFASDSVLIDGTHVAELGTMRGTDTGGFLGLTPTGRPFRVLTAWLYTLNDRRFTYVRPVYDFTGMLVQIGAMKAKPQ